MEKISFRYMILEVPIVMPVSESLLAYAQIYQTIVQIERLLSLPAIKRLMGKAGRVCFKQWLTALQ
jgi:hypothetical protein